MNIPPACSLEGYQLHAVHVLWHVHQLLLFLFSAVFWKYKCNLSLLFWTVHSYHGIYKRERTHYYKLWFTKFRIDCKMESWFLCWVISKSNICLELPKWERLMFPANTFFNGLFQIERSWWEYHMECRLFPVRTATVLNEMPKTGKYSRWKWHVIVCARTIGTDGSVHKPLWANEWYMPIAQVR